MRASGDYPHEMADLSDREIDALFAGRSNVGGGDLRELVQAAKVASQQPPAPEVQRRHLAAIVEEAQITSASQQGLAPRSRRNKMRRIFRPAWVKALAIVGVALAASTGLASAGVMPDPAQDALSKVAEKLGVDIPASDNAGKKAEDPESTEDEAGDEDTGTAGEDVEGAGTEGENGKSVADDVHAVLEDETLEGREKGDAVSDAASQNRQNETHSHSRVGNPSPSPAGGQPDELPGGNPNG